MRDSAIHNANLEALRSVDPALAQRLDSAPLPPAAKPTPTRDSRISFSWGHPSEPQWLGGTTVPGARAHGLIDSFQIAAGNALFVGFGAGTEAAELLSRSPLTSALFVIEPEPAAAAMVLRVVDLAAPIAARRLVLFVGDDAWPQLHEFLLANPGFLAPQRVLAWPWLSRNQHHEIAARLSALAASLTASRESETAKLRHTAQPRGGRGIAIVSLSPEPRDSHVASGIAWGIEQLGRPAKTYCADAPSRMHSAALARFLADSEFAELVLLNATAADLSELLPVRVPVRTWLTLGAAVPPDLASRIGADAEIIVSSESQRNALITAGLNPSRIILAPPAAQPSATSRRKRILVLAPDGDDRPETVGLHLSSHLALWDAARTALAAQADQLWSDDIPAAINRAETASTVRIIDPSVRKGILERIQNALAPAILRRAYEDALNAAEIEFDLVPAGRLPDPTTAYAAVIQLALDSDPTCELLDAVANGARPIIRTRQGRLPTAVAGFLPANCLTPISTAPDLINVIRAAPDGASAREHVLNHHTWSDRLRDVLTRST